VNDRYREDAWLLSELDGSRNLNFGITASTKLSTSRALSLMASNTEKPPEPTTADVKSTPDADKAPVSIDVGPFNRFRSLLTYREQVRSLMIENQLDDRHDLRGNSLYRLKFDAAVFPGHNTRRSAKVTVSVLPQVGILDRTITSGNLNDAKELTDENRRVWERIYMRWLDSLKKRFDDGEKAIRKAYTDNRFSPGYYGTLLDGIYSKEQELYDYINSAAEALTSSDVEKIRKCSPKSPVEPDLFESLVVKRNFKPGALKDITVALDDFSECYAQGIINPLDRVHRMLKTEIKDHIATVVYQQSLSFTLSAIKKYEQTTDNPDKKVEEKVEVCSRELQGSSELTPQQALIYFMNVGFKAILSKSILGQDLDDPNFLALAEVVEKLEQESETFTFEPRIMALHVTDGNAYSSNEPITISARNIYYAQSDLVDIKEYLPSYDIRKGLNNDKGFKGEVDKWGNEDRTHKSEIKVGVGLTNFIRLAGRRLDAFSYAFTPSEPDEISATQALEKSSAALRLQAAGAQAGGSGNASLGKEAEKDWNAVRKLVIGFGEQAHPTIPKFGWMIQPQEQVDVGSQHYRHRASQLSLTALISLPAWWDEVIVTVEREWAPESQVSEKESDHPETKDDPMSSCSSAQATVGGSARSTARNKTHNCDPYTIELPVNFETIDAALFEKNTRGPVIEEWALQPIELRVCDEGAALIIPGRRLWRSTIVTLGSQKADEIFVLPDMNGIIASFNKIKAPASSPGVDGKEDFHVPITVWTSQGSVTLPLLATIHNKDRDGKPYSCPAESERAQPQPSAVSSARAAAPTR
jgi:hypothetical protein